MPTDQHTEFADAQAEIERLREREAELQGRVQTLADGGRDTRAAMDRLNGLLEQARADVERETAAREAAEAQFAALSDEARAAREEAKGRAAEVIAAERASAEAHGRAEQEVSRRAELEAQSERDRTAAEQGLRVATEETKQELAKRVEVERDNERLTGELARHASEREVHSQQMSEAKRVVRAARAQAADAQDKIERAERRAADAERVAQREQQRRSSIEERLASLAQGMNPR